MAFFNSGANKLIRALKLDSKFIFSDKNKTTMLPTVAPLANDRNYDFATIFDLGAIGFTAMAWLSAMDAAVRFKSSFDAFLRYEDMIVAKERLIVALLTKIGLAKNAAVADVDVMTAIFATDAHGENAATTSSRFSTGKGRLFIAPADAARVEALLARHPVLKSGDFVFAETLNVA